MDMFLNSAVFSHLPLPKFSTISRKPPLKARTVYCSGKSGEDSNFSQGPFQLELDSHDSVDASQSINIEKEVKHNDIWQLFREAQQNILYLHKQRLMALEKLDKMKEEKKLLLDKIAQMEEKDQANFRKDHQSVNWEMLLSLDAMVLKGMIAAREASSLRRLVMDSKVSVADDFSGFPYESDAELVSALRSFSDKSKRKAFHIIHICTEMAPLVSSGTLASYVTGLSRALQRKGNWVEVILPKYASLHMEEVHGLREVEAEFYSYFNGQLHANKIWTGVVYGIGVTFIQPINYSSFFSHERVYGYPNDFERFSYFSRASLDYIVKSGKQPDFLHIHNWETALVGPLFWDVFVNQGLEGTQILLTCHGCESQRLEQPDKLALCGLDPSRLHRSDRLQDNSKTHLVNILKGGVVYANKVIIMSSMYSKSQIIHSLSHGLESTFAIHKDKLLIAPCGFDNSIWDPSMDKFLPESFSADNLKGKAGCKVALQQHLGLSQSASIILIGCIISEVSDIDVENLKTLVWIASRRNVQFVFMGTTTIPVLNGALKAMQEELKDESVRFLDKYDEASFHLILGGSDIILCQSFEDPVLQLPLKALRYGAAPVALTPTPTPVDNHFNDLESSKFSRYIGNTFANVSLNQAIDEINNNPSQWNRKIMDAMKEDFSWDAECCNVHLSAYTSIKKNT